MLNNGNMFRPSNLYRQPKEATTKHYFVIKNKLMEYNCYVDEELHVYVLNHNSDVIGRAKLQNIFTLSEAAEAARSIIFGSGNNR